MFRTTLILSLALSLFSACDEATPDTALAIVDEPITLRSEAVLCNPFAQDCQDGQKCMPYANDGGTAWNATKCVDTTGYGIAGDRCTVFSGSVGGEDDCAEGFMCWDVDQEMNGTCIELCSGSADAPECGDYTTCFVGNEGVLPICLPTCNPLAGCGEGEVCISHSGSNFYCALDASGEEGQVFDPCEFTNACDDGLGCFLSELAVECDPNSLGCCLPYCDTTDANTCPGTDQTCVPYFLFSAPPVFESWGEEPILLDFIGYCSNDPLS